MAEMTNNEFGIRCQHIHLSPFNFHLVCPDCRLWRQLQSENQQKEPIKNSKKANKKVKQQKRKQKKYGSL